MSFQNKDMLGISLIEMLKPYIKNNQNDYVIKTLDIVKDGVEAYLELLSVAIFHKNFEIIKLIIEKYINSEIHVLYINALYFYNSILSENSRIKLNDNKDNYIEIKCPFAIMGGIGGDIEIFQYLLNHNLISDLNILGTIGLSYKFKNAFNSNIIGACAYYGNEKLLEYLLKNYRSELDINIYTTEKQSKKTNNYFSKELSDTSPALLACAGPASDEKTIEILKILEDYKANFKNKDFNNNNIIHISIRRKKINTFKFLINSLELKELMNEPNNDNKTPFNIALQMKNQEMIKFFKNFGKVDEKQNEEDKKEILEDSNTKNIKIIKKEINNQKIENPLLLNYSEYQEVFNENKKEENKDNKILLEDNKNIKYINEIKEEKSYNNKEKNEDNKVYNKYKNNYIYNNNANNNYKYKSNYDYYKNYENNNKNKNYKNNNYKSNNYYNNYKNNNYEDNYKNNNYKNKYNENKIYENNNDYDYKNKNDGIYKNTYQKTNYNNNYGYFERNKNSFNKIYYEDNNPTKNNFFMEKTDKTNENNENSNVINVNNNEIKIKKNEQNENENNIKENKENISEEDNEDFEEGSYSDEDFLNENEDKIKNKEVNNYEYNKLFKKYLDLERKCYNLEKEKKEIYKYINKMNLNKKINIKIMSNNEESINSLLDITNIELKSKDEYIKELRKHCIMADLTNIGNFKKEKLNLYKDFYIKNLNIIDNALKENAN